MTLKKRLGAAALALAAATGVFAQSAELDPSKEPKKYEECTWVLGGIRQNVMTETKRLNIIRTYDETYLALPLKRTLPAGSRIATSMCDHSTDGIVELRSIGTDGAHVLFRCTNGPLSYGKEDGGERYTIKKGETRAIGLTCDTGNAAYTPKPAMLSLTLKETEGGIATLETRLTPFDEWHLEGRQ